MVQGNIKQREERMIYHTAAYMTIAGLSVVNKTCRKLLQSLINMETGATPGLRLGTETHTRSQSLMIISKLTSRFTALFQRNYFVKIAKYISLFFFFNFFAFEFFFSGDNNGWSLQLDKYFANYYKLASTNSFEAETSECCK